MSFLCNLKVPEDEENDEEEEENDDAEDNDDKKEDGGKEDEKEDDSSIPLSNVRERKGQSNETKADNHIEVETQNRIRRRENGNTTTPTELCIGMANINFKPNIFTLSFRDVESFIRGFSGKDGYPVRK